MHVADKRVSKQWLLRMFKSSPKLLRASGQGIAPFRLLSVVFTDEFLFLTKSYEIPIISVGGFHKHISTNSCGYS